MADSVAPANWYHARVPQFDIELIHLRMPWWRLARTRSEYRADLAAILAQNVDRRLVVCGDFNHDPFHGLAAEVPQASWPGLDGFVVERPAGEWSFINKQGTGTSRIDHVMHTKSVVVRDVRYEWTYDGVLLAGPHVPSTTSAAEQPISDHAPLLFDIHLN